MLKGKTIAVVVPAYNEENQIGMVIESMPDYVDRIIVVNDKSKDRTEEVVREFIKNDTSEKIEILSNTEEIELTTYNEADVVLRERNIKELSRFVPSEIVNEDPTHDRIILINNLVNGGVGAGISRGYKWCKDHEIDVTAVMAGDGQMDPSELESLCLPVIEENIDYVKGNRLIHRSAWFVIPKTRFVGNAILSILTKLASGYWKVSDTQTGYTAISKNALNAIKLYNIYRSYGMPNDLLVKLNISSCTIKEVQIKPIYRVGEESKMKIFMVIPRVSLLLVKSFFKRLYLKYLFKDFHPLFLFYHFSFFMGGLSLPYFFKILKAFYLDTVLSYEPILAFFFLFTAAFQSLFFAMWMDIQDNDRLYK